MGHNYSKKKAASGGKKQGIAVHREMDLHGLTIEAALRQFNKLLSSTQWPPSAVIRIIHGHSNTGEDSIKMQLHRQLQGPLSHRIQDFYLEPFNPGATLIVLEVG
jgi:DNA-nicking Smr family endonuclease